MNIEELRRTTIAEIKAMVKPHLRSAPAYGMLRLVTFGSSKLKPEYYAYRGISGAFSVQEAEFMGFTARGIILDCEMGGLVVQTYPLRL